MTRTSSPAPVATPPLADLHCDTIGLIQNGADILSGTAEWSAGSGGPDAGPTGKPAARGHVDIPRMRAGGVALQTFAAFVAPKVPPDQAFATTVAKLETIEAICRKHHDHLQLIRDTSGAMHAASEGRIGVLLAVENGHAIEESLDRLSELAERGVRILTIVHSKNTTWAASCTDKNAPFDGLSPLGERIVDAMEEMDMLVDVSHCNEAAFWKVARRARKPFIASHSNAWELCKFPRNLKDDQIRAVADAGGVIGINFCPDFLELLRDGRKVTSETVVRHIDYMVSLVGDENVAFGSDFDGIPGTPEDVTGSDCYPVILDLLRQRGYSEETLRRLCWGNVMRVLG